MGVSTSLVRPLQPSDEAAWKRLRLMLWPDNPVEANDRECRDILVGKDHDLAVFVSESANELTGFVEVSLRKYADECESSPVGFLEGIFVVPQFRRQGIARRLASAAEVWARERGCLEMASDTRLDNAVGERMHLALGYQEVERAIRYRKDLARRSA